MDDSILLMDECRFSYNVVPQVNVFCGMCEGTIPIEDLATEMGTMARRINDDIRNHLFDLTIKLSTVRLLA